MHQAAATSARAGDRTEHNHTFTPVQLPVSLRLSPDPKQEIP